MTTTAFHHRPAPFIAAAAAVVAIAAGSAAWAVSQQSGHPGSPGEHSQTSVQPDAPRAHHFQPTTSGGHVMLGG